MRGVIIAASLLAAFLAPVSAKVSRHTIVTHASVRHDAGVMALASTGNSEAGSANDRAGRLIAPSSFD